MPRLKLVVAYQGTRYAGWQLQARRQDASPPTIQGELERCFTRCLGCRVPVHGAGRTDSGVHAEAQVCHVDLPDGYVGVDWPKALNTQLPPDIRVLAAEWAGPDFHARRSALRKRYAYSLWMDRDKALPRVSEFVWSAPPLDMARLSALLPLLPGRRDFASFQNSGTPVRNTVRTLYAVSLRRGRIAGLVCPAAWPVVTLEFEGDGFLKQMVRNLVGLAVWAGQGKIALEEVADIFAARNRKALRSPSAPAQGLTLLEVVYPGPDTV